MGKSSHSLLKTLMKRFQTSYELKMEIKNVDIYVEKYLRAYKKAGMSLSAWETWGDALFAAVVLGCFGVNSYLIWSKTTVEWKMSSSIRRKCINTRKNTLIKKENSWINCCSRNRFSLQKKSKK